MADGRQIKGGIVIHPIVASAIFGAIVTIGGAMYYNSNAQAKATRDELAWQHDKLITLTVQKEEGEKRAAHDAEELSKRLQNMDAVQLVLGRDIAKLQESQKSQRTRN